MVPVGKTGLKFRYGGNTNLLECTNCIGPSETIAAMAASSAGNSESNTAETRHGTSLPLLVVVLMIAGATMIFLCWVALRCWKAVQSKQNLNGDKSKIAGTEKPYERPTWTVYTRNFSLDELRRATKNFSPDYIIGSGGFGLVYKAALDSCEMVAIKRAQQKSCQGANEFHNEVQLLSKIHHKHLVNLVGFCEEEGEQMLVYEYVPNGSLLEHIIGQRGLPLTWRQRVQIAIGAAKGCIFVTPGFNSIGV